MPSDLPLICQERSRLLRAYLDAAGSYATRVREMAEFVMLGDEARASQARRFSRTVLQEAESFRLALYRHEADHSCDRTMDLQRVPRRLTSLGSTRSVRIPLRRSQQGFLNCPGSRFQSAARVRS
jgi:hypothetical protein